MPVSKTRETPEQRSARMRELAQRPRPSRQITVYRGRITVPVEVAPDFLRVLELLVAKGGADAS